jgi:hypothetical protein
MTRFIRFGFLFASIAGVRAQNAITLAGGGYAPPRLAQDAAPGQLLVVYLFGIQTNIPVAQLGTLPLGSSIWPDNIDGVSVDLVQGNPAEITPVQVRGIQQAQCPQPQACSPITGITIQVPFSIHTDYLAKGEPVPQLRIGENGAVVGAVMLRPVSDSVHVIGTCDNTLIFLSAAFDIPQGFCVPMVMNGQRLDTLTNPSHVGDTLAMWLYGLGATTPGPGPDLINNLPKPIQQFRLNFDFRPNATGSPAVAGFGLTDSPRFVAYLGAGLYQINFTVPAIPAGVPLCDNVRVKSNLTVTVSGSNSFDAAQICVAP